MLSNEFLTRLDELYEAYLKTNQGDVDTEFLKDDLLDLLLEYKKG